MNGKINKIESFATHDGIGIRVAVFMQGCNLRCVYCHNPETWEVFCVPKEEYSPSELTKKLLRFKPYFTEGGGVTFSGGEPLLQAPFLIEAARLLKNSGVNIALDTSLSVFNEPVKELYNTVDLVIADLKFCNKEGYIKHCGIDIFDIVTKSFDYFLETNKRIWVRTVIVPGINDSREDIENYNNFLTKYKKIIEKYELLPFHTLGFGKYKELNIKNPLYNTNPLSILELKELNKWKK